MICEKCHRGYSGFDPLLCNPCKREEKANIAETQEHPLGSERTSSKGEPEIYLKTTAHEYVETTG